MACDSQKSAVRFAEKRSAIFKARTLPSLFSWTSKADREKFCAEKKKTEGLFHFLSLPNQSFHNFPRPRFDRLWMKSFEKTKEEEKNPFSSSIPYTVALWRRNGGPDCKSLRLCVTFISLQWIQNMECFIRTSSGGRRRQRRSRSRQLSPRPSGRWKKKKKNHENFSFPGSPSPPSTQAKTSLPAALGLLFFLFWNLLPNPAERWIYHLCSVPVALTRQERTRFRGGQRRRDGLNFGVDVLAPSHRVTSADTLVRAVQIARTSFGLLNLRTLVCLITGDKRWPASTSPLYFTVSICVDF